MNRFYLLGYYVKKNSLLMSLSSYRMIWFGTRDLMIASLQIIALFWYILWIFFYLLFFITFFLHELHVLTFWSVPAWLSLDIEEFWSEIFWNEFIYGVHVDLTCGGEWVMFKYCMDSFEVNFVCQSFDDSVGVELYWLTHCGLVTWYGE